MIRTLIHKFYKTVEKFYISQKCQKFLSSLIKHTLQLKSPLTLKLFVSDFENLVVERKYVIICNKQFKKIVISVSNNKC